MTAMPAPCRPFGWRFEPREVTPRGKVINFNIVRDPATFPFLDRILRAGLRGEGDQKIANDLTRDGVPTPEQFSGITGCGGHAGGAAAWHNGTVHNILSNPINCGIVRSFKTKRVQMPPDARHPKRWYTHVAVPVDQQVTLHGDIVFEPAITIDEWKRLCHPDRQQRRFDSADAANDAALLAGGLMRHGACNGRGRLRVKHVARTYGTGRDGRPGTPNYACVLHERQPSECPGLSLRVETLDTLLWEAVRRVLLVPGRLEHMAEAQREADLAALERDTGAGSAKYLEAGLRDLKARRDSYLETIGRTTDRYVKASAEAEVARLGPLIDEAEAQIAEARAVEQDDVRRRAVLADVQRQLARYAGVVAMLRVQPDPSLLRLQRAVLRVLGFRGTVWVEGTARNGGSSGYGWKQNGAGRGRRHRAVVHGRGRPASR